MRYVVARADEIPPGGRKIVQVAGRSVGVFNLGGEFFALRNRCPHQGGPMCEGPLWGRLESARPGEFRLGPPELVTCLWHCWEYSIRTGQSWWNPDRMRVRRYDVSLEPADAAAPADPADPADAPPAPGLVPGPYRAETYPAARDGHLVVVDVPD